MTIEPGFYTLELTARNENSSYIFNQSLTQIECTQDGYGVYVLTDKPVYRDSDKGWDIYNSKSLKFIQFFIFFKNIL